MVPNDPSFGPCIFFLSFLFLLTHMMYRSINDAMSRQRGRMGSNDVSFGPMYFLFFFVLFLVLLTYMMYRSIYHDRRTTPPLRCRVTTNFRSRSTTLTTTLSTTPPSQRVDDMAVVPRHHYSVVWYVFLYYCFLLYILT